VFFGLCQKKPAKSVGQGKPGKEALPRKREGRRTNAKKLVDYRWSKQAKEKEHPPGRKEKADIFVPRGERQLPIATEAGGTLKRGEKIFRH